MNREKVELDGVEYELGQYKWGEGLEIDSSCIEVNLKGSGIKGKSVKDIISNLEPQVDVQKMELMTVLKSLKKWTFRGYDEEDNLKLEGEVLPINEETLKTIPIAHGNELANVATKLNNVGGTELKNL